MQALALVAPENHQKYRSQVQMGVAIYLDAYTNPRGVRWRVDDLGRPVIERLRQNLTNALAVTDEYVWLWGEKSHWFETASTEWHAERQNGKTWQQALPGIERAFRWARNPMQAAADDLPSLKSSDRLRNVVRNGSFEHAATRAPENAASDWGYEKMPDSWSSWQKDYSHGTMEWDPPAGRSGRGAVKAVGVTHGCFIQTIEVKPGQQYIIEAYSRAAGQAKPLLKVRWRGKTGDWISTYHDVSALFDSQSDDEQGEWLRSVTILTVPERAKQMVVLLYSFGGESDADIVWFSDIGAYELTPEVLW